MIPKKIHYVWVGPRPLPLKFVETWRALNPGYEFILWNEENIDFSHRFIQSAYAVGAWNRVSNFVRAMALLKHGGFYLDTDIEPRRPLDDLRGNACLLGFQRPNSDPNCVNNAVMGAMPGHWLMEKICRRLNDEFDGWRFVWDSSGPGLVTKLLFEEGLAGYRDDAPQRVRDVAIYPVRYFYPYWVREEFTEACVTPDTYLIHHWDVSWAPQRDEHGKPIVPLAQRARNRFARYMPAVACRTMQTRVGLEKAVRKTRSDGARHHASH